MFSVALIEKILCFASPAKFSRRADLRMKGGASLIINGYSNSGRLIR
jgi:hypothetical protein